MKPKNFLVIFFLVLFLFFTGIIEMVLSMVGLIISALFSAIIIFAFIIGGTGYIFYLFFIKEDSSTKNKGN